TEELNDTDDDTATSESSSSRERSSTGRRVRRGRQAVNYSELNIDDDGNDDVSSSRRKRKQSAKKETNKRGGKSSKKRRSSTSTSTISMTDSDEGSESDFTVELSGDESSFKGSDDDTLGLDSDNDDEYTSSKRKSRKTDSIPWNEIPLEASGLVSRVDQVDHERMVRYRKAAEQVGRWLATVDTLDLPANPLDRLLNELGGPDKVAELTGRKTRQVEIYDAMEDKKKVIFEKRKGEGRLDQINIEEKNHFQSGAKKIAILSEAASTGISLQADKRVKNQDRRVHITLELPWSADKAIQQLGRTHRSNQSSGPIYKFLISDVGGEKRFASAVARRLALLGALTQGDRRATGSANSLGLGSFDMDNRYGKNALKSMFGMIWNCSTVSVMETEDEDDKLYVEALRGIDIRLTEALEDGGDWEDNLVPYEVRTIAEETHAMLMYNLFTGRLKRLAHDRVHAIKDGRSIAGYMDSLANGTETKESVKPMIDEELTKAKEAGLNFNVLCNFWLYDVGVMYSDRKDSDVPRFLNRLLGMNLNRQRLMTQYFMKALENEINSAKSSGKYDVGIRTLKGNSLEFADKPRVFSFRGLTAKDDRVHLYTVAQDVGTSPGTAMELYNEAKDSNAPTSRNEWNRRGHRLEMVTGFYTDSRGYLKVTPKVFLIINSGAHRNSCTVIRPNTVRRTEAKSELRKKLMEGRLAACPDVDEAMAIWNREFELADIPADHEYQFSCTGRHKENFIFAGSIVPILNKMFAAGNISSRLEGEAKPYSVVRVETSAGASSNTDTEKDASRDEPDSEDEPEEEETRESEMVAAEPVVEGEEDIGKGVAHTNGKVGSTVFRGEITKYKDDDMNDDCDPSGTFFAKFSDGFKLKMDANQVNNARKLFEKEANALVSCGMPRVDACNSLDIQTAAGKNGKSKIRQPVLENGEDDPENYEQIFEEKFDGEVPDAIVGLMFDHKPVYMKDALNNDITVSKTEMVLRNLSKRLISEGVESARQLYNLEKAERLADDDASCGSKSDED
ncbi:hypothetical protein ACHAXR_006716, partial [Thalassiosira sp. AJA248-18]